MADITNTSPTIGDVWNVRVFRDDALVLRVFRIMSFHNLSIGVQDIETGSEQTIYFTKTDLQFLDLLSRQEMKELPREEGRGAQGGSRGPDQTSRGGGRPRNDAGIRKERDR